MYTLTHTHTKSKLTVAAIPTFSLPLYLDLHLKYIEEHLFTVWFAIASSLVCVCVCVCASVSEPLYMYYFSLGNIRIRLPLNYWIRRKTKKTEKKRSHLKSQFLVERTPHTLIHTHIVRVYIVYGYKKRQLKSVSLIHVNTVSPPNSHSTLSI